MTIPYYEDPITWTEERNNRPYAGYFSPDGKIVGFNTVIGGGFHDTWVNPVTQIYLSYVSYIIKGTSIKKLKKRYIEGILCPPEMQEYPGLDEYVMRGYKRPFFLNDLTLEEFLENLDDYFINYQKHLKELGEYVGKSYGSQINEYDKFSYALLEFFKHAYQNQRFFESIQRKIAIDSDEALERKYKKLFKSADIDDIRNLMRKEKLRQILSFVKDIYVEYLGYDSLERFNPEGEFLKIPKYGEDYHQNFDFSKWPRVITSTYQNTNERYYNYLLMDWVIHKVPRYIFNEQKGIYEIDEFINNYQSEKEEILGKEIASIRRLVPLKERPKYFR